MIRESNIAKTLPCGVTLKLSTSVWNDIMTVEIADPSIISSFRIIDDGKISTLRLYITEKNLPVIRELLDLVEPPKPKWYEFWRKS